MRWLLLVPLALVAYRLTRRRGVSHAWLVDHERREWTHGIDGVIWKWPVKN